MNVFDKVRNLVLVELDKKENAIFSGLAHFYACSKEHLSEEERKSKDAVLRIEKLFDGLRIMPLFNEDWIYYYVESNNNVPYSSDEDIKREINKYLENHTIEAFMILDFYHNFLEDIFINEDFEDIEDYNIKENISSLTTILTPLEKELEEIDEFADLFWYMNLCI